MSTQLDTQHYRQSQGNSPFLEGDLLYEKGDFKMALHAYENLDAGNFAFDKKLRVALCHWQLGNHAEALKLLESLYQPKDNLRYLEAAWFLALIRLETGEKTAAKLYLEEVRDL